MLQTTNPTLRRTSWPKNSCFVLGLVFILWGCQHPDPSPKDPAVLKDQESSDLSSNQLPIFTAPKKVGLILGGGGALTYAEIGVLHQLDRYGVNIVAIGGLEWGALVAAAYSQKSQVHQVEWQLLKIPTSQFSKKGIFSQSYGGGSIKNFRGFLKFFQTPISKGSIPFACPFVTSSSATTRLATQGSYTEALDACWPYPPHFKKQEKMAAPLEVSLLVDFLKKQGAQVILYIDVLKENPLMTESEKNKFPHSVLLWEQAQSFVKNLKNLGVNEVFSLSLTEPGLASYKKMRSLIRLGQVKSRDFIKRFAKESGY